jgi:integrase
LGQLVATMAREPPSDEIPDAHIERWIYDLRHTFATLALRAGISTFDLYRYMGASLTMIDRHKRQPRCMDAKTRSRRQSRQRK